MYKINCWGIRKDDIALEHNAKLGINRNTSY